MPPKRPRGVNVPPQLMKIVQEANMGNTTDDVSTAIIAIESKSIRVLNSYLHSICMRMNL
jgi:hypothetical protein